MPSLRCFLDSATSSRRLNSEPHVNDILKCFFFLQPLKNDAFLEIKFLERDRVSGINLQHTATEITDLEAGVQGFAQNRRNRLLELLVDRDLCVTPSRHQLIDERTESPDSWLSGGIAGGLEGSR